MTTIELDALIMKSEIIARIEDFTKRKNIKCKKREKLNKMNICELIKYLSKKEAKQWLK